MLTRPFTRLIVAFGVRKITQRRLAEEFVTGILILVPFGLLIGLLTSRICTKIHFSSKTSSTNSTSTSTSTSTKGRSNFSYFNIRSDVWTTLVVFLIGDILMEWLLPSLGCLPIPVGERIIESSTGVVGLSTTGSSSAAAMAMMMMMIDGDNDGSGDIGSDDDYVSNILSGIADEKQNEESSFYNEDEYHYTLRWLLQSYGLYCPINFANSDSLLTPDATAILFSIRLIFLCIGVHVGESIGSFVALTGGIATGKSTAAQMFVNYNNYNNEKDNEKETYNDTNNEKVSRNNNNSNNNNNNNAGSSSCSSWWGRNNAFSTAFLFADDGYNEGTVQLICADSIAHSILLPPEMLAVGTNNKAAKNNSQGKNKHSSHDSSEEDDDDNDDDDDDDDENNTSNGDDDEDDNNNNKNKNKNNPNDINFISPKDSVYHQILKAFEGKDILKEESTTTNNNNNNNGNNQRQPKEIDRLKLGSIIFNDRIERRKLNSITHSKILSVLIRKLLRSVFFGVTDITIADLPLLFESGKLSWLFGITICITVSDPSIQLHRLQIRNPELPKKECQARIDSQMSLEKKQYMADIIITNDGDLNELREQVEDVRKDIMGRLYGIGMSLLQMLLLIGGSTSIAVSSKFYTHWQ
jgi:dephospho-CoA kinase